MIWVNFMEKLTIIDKSWWKCQGAGRMENQVGFGLVILNT